MSTKKDITAKADIKNKLIASKNARKEQNTEVIKKMITKYEKLLEELKKDPTKRYTNKEYDKALRWARRTRRKVKKANALLKNISTEKTYCVMAMYDSRLYPTVKDAVAESVKAGNMANPAIITDVYFYIKDVDSKALQNLRDTVSNIKLELKGHKPMKIIVQAHKNLSWAQPKNLTHENKKPTNNTVTAKRVARAKRKVANIAKHQATKGHKQRRKEHLLKTKKVELNSTKLKFLIRRRLHNCNISHGKK